MKSGNIIIKRKFNIPNKTDFSFIAKIRPIMSIILKINKLVRPVGIKFINSTKKSTGSKYEIIKTKTPAINKYLLRLFSYRPPSLLLLSNQLDLFLKYFLKINYRLRYLYHKSKFQIQGNIYIQNMIIKFLCPVLAIFLQL